MPIIHLSINIDTRPRVHKKYILLYMTRRMVKKQRIKISNAKGTLKPKLVETNELVSQNETYSEKN
jgi:hypothetical protein